MPYTNWENSRETPPAMDCIQMKHLWVENTEPGAFLTELGEIPTAAWCLWCGTGVSNELLLDEDGNEIEPL